MRRIVFSFIAIACLFMSRAEAQSVYTTGNLLRIPFYSSQINYADTLGFWDQYNVGQSGYSYRKYADHISTPQKNYFLQKYESYQPVPGSYFGLYSGGQFIESDNLLLNQAIAQMPGPSWDIPEPYMLKRTIVTETKNGRWLINGAFGNAFHFNNDSVLRLYPYSNILPESPFSERLKSVIGKVEGKYLVSFFRLGYGSGLLHEYYLTDLEDSPYIDSLKLVRVNFIGDSTFMYNPLHSYSPPAALSVMHITGDLYVMEADPGMGISFYRFSDMGFHYIKTVLKDEITAGFGYSVPWKISNGKLFMLLRSELISYDFSSTDTSFVNRKILLSKLVYPNNASIYSANYNFGIDRNFRYAAKIFRGPETKYLDTLKIYDIDKGAFISSLVLKDVWSPFLPVMDSPYVYIHQFKYRKTTGVKGNDNAAAETYRLSAYPNPFNASVKILYSTPENGNVEITVYDLLGQKVATLVKGYKEKGEHFVIFNATDLSSGTYFYTMTAGSHMKTEKLILMK